MRRSGHAANIQATHSIDPLDHRHRVALTRIAQLAIERDPFTASDRRVAFLDGASGLAHLYIGFAALARAAIGRLLTA